MATKASRTIPNGMLYNYNPFTNIMPPNESWLYYKYTTTGVDLVHDLLLDSDKILLDANGDADIFVLYAGSGSKGGKGGIVEGDEDNWYCGGAGGSGEANLTKINFNNIKNNKIQINLTNIDTSILYSNNLNNTITLNAYGNNYDANGCYGAKPATYNKNDRPLNNKAYYNGTLYCGSVGGRTGVNCQNIQDNENLIVMCDDYSIINNIKVFKSEPTYLIETNKNTNYYGYFNLKSSLLFNNDWLRNNLIINFSNNDLLSDNTGVGSILKSGKLGFPKIIDTIDKTLVIPRDGENGSPGFVMIFYKVKTPIVQTISLNLNLTSYNPINNIAPNNKYSYYYYKNSATHYVSDNYVNVNGIKPNANGKKIVNVLFVGGGGTGGSSSKRKGGGGGGGGGEVALSTIPFENIKNGIINISINGVGGSTDIFYNDPSNKQFKFTAIAGYKGTNGDTDGKGKGGQGANGLAIRPNNSVITTFYGSGCGGGGSGLSNDTIASRGTIQPNVNSPNPTLNSNKCSRGVSIADIGDGTGEVQTSFGGYGGSGENSGSDGNPGFVLIYYLVYG
jgi:hypothetical protein